MVLKNVFKRIIYLELVLKLFSDTVITLRIITAQFQTSSNLIVFHSTVCNHFPINGIFQIIGYAVPPLLGT